MLVIACCIFMLVNSSEIFELGCEKTCLFQSFDQVPHKSGCTTIEDDEKLEILEEEGLYYL